MNPEAEIPKPGRCLHWEGGVCPACKVATELFVARVPTLRKGDPPWTATFGELSRMAVDISALRGGKGR